MNTSIQQTIETLAKEKGIDSEEVISAIEEAVLTASRKYYKTDENLKTAFNRETGAIELFAVKVIVPDSDMDNEDQQISLTAAQELYGDDAEVDMEIDFHNKMPILR